MRQIWDKLVKGTASYLKDNGFNKCVVAISGGIDSSLVTAIAAAAVGPENVLGVMMPSPHSSEGSVADALALARNLRIKTLKIPIEPLMKAFDAALMESFKGYEKDTTEENIQARIRGVLVMALSNKYGAMVLNTCNKSEDYVGYCTLYGDSCGGIAPIGKLYKTDVYKLARWMNGAPDLPDVPEAVLIKKPSAELAPGQKDEDDLPPYDLLDRVLKLHLDDGMGKETIVEKGFDKKLVERIIRLIKASEFKRRQSPPPIQLD